MAIKKNKAVTAPVQIAELLSKGKTEKFPSLLKPMLATLAGEP